MSEFISKNVEIRPKTKKPGENEKNERRIEKKRPPRPYINKGSPGYLILDVSGDRRDHSQYTYFCPESQYGNVRIYQRIR